MKKNKYATILILSLFVFSLANSVSLVSAVSAETTGLDTYGFDTNQQTYALVGGYHIFAFDNKLAFYDEAATLIKTHTLPAFTTYSSETYANGTRTAILALDDTTLIVASITSGYRNVAGFNPAIVLNYNIGLLNVNTLGYTAVVSSSVTGGNFAGTQFIGAGAEGTGLVLLKNTNSSGSFFYIFMGIDGKMKIDQTVNHANFAEFAYFGKYVGSSWTSGWSVKLDDAANSLIYPGAFAITSEMPENTAFVVCSNGYQGGNRAVVYLVSFAAPETVTYVGVTGLDWTYGGNYGAWPGMNYFMGSGIFNNMVCANFAYSGASASMLGVSTIIFNSTSVSSSYFLYQAIGIQTDNVMTRPFYVGLPSPNGNVSGVYSVAYWDDINAPRGLTGVSFHLTNLEVAAPTWSAYQFGFMFTPQSPKVFNYTTGEIGGFQPKSSDVGLYVDLTNGACKADTFENTNPSYAFQGTMTGGIYSNMLIVAYNPTQFPMQQGVTYTFKGYNYINSIISGDGTFTVETTGLSLDSTVGTNGAYTEILNSTITDGYFSVTISARNSPDALVYQGFRVTVDVPTYNEVSEVTYLFAFYDQLPLGSTTPGPNPSNLPDVIDWTTNGLTVLFLPLFIMGILPLAGAIFAGFAGMFIGWNAAGVITVVSGLFSPWVIIVVVLTDIVALYMRPQIETISGSLGRRLKGEG